MNFSLLSIRIWPLSGHLAISLAAFWPISGYYISDRTEMSKRTIVVKHVY
jgi:hypothetical protein